MNRDYYSRRKHTFKKRFNKIKFFFKNFKRGTLKLKSLFNQKFEFVFIHILLQTLNNYVLMIYTTSIGRMWGAFVDCVRSYTNHFLTPDQLDAFGEAIEPSMQSIHQLCAEDALYREGEAFKVTKNVNLI